MAPHEEMYGGIGLSRLPPSMQSLRERIGGLKAATELGSSGETAVAISSQHQRPSDTFERLRDRALNTEKAARVAAASQQSLTNESPSLQRRRSSWETELDEYLSISSDTAAGLELRGRLQSPEAWLRFLQEHEQLQGSCKYSEAASEIGISRLYEWATKAIPRSLNISNEDYVRIWTGYAKHQMETSEEDARQIFKYLKSHHIGHGLACLYEEWALFEVAAGQPQKALQKVQEGIRQQATPAGHLEELQSKLLTSLQSRSESNLPAHPSPIPAPHSLERLSWPRSASAFQPSAPPVEQPSPLLRSHSLDKAGLALPPQSTPSTHQIRPQQGTPSAYRQQPFQPSLQPIPSPADAESLTTPSREAVRGTPRSFPSQRPESSKPSAAEERWRPDLTATSVQSVVEPTSASVLAGQDAAKGDFSTPYGKSRGSSSGGVPADGTTTFGMPTPSFGLGTSTLGKSGLPGGFKFDDTAHSGAGSCYVSQDNGRETGYGHTSHSVGGRSSIGSSFRWQPSPTSVTTRQLTTGVSSMGAPDRSQNAEEGPDESQVVLGGADVAGAPGRQSEKGADHSAGQSETVVGGREPAGLGQERIRDLRESLGRPGVPREWPPAIRRNVQTAGVAETGEASAGGSVSPTETVELPKGQLPDVSLPVQATRGREDGLQSRVGTPRQGGGEKADRSWPSLEELADRRGLTPGDQRGTVVATSATAAGGQSLTERNGPSSGPPKSAPPPLKMERPALSRGNQPTGVALERPQWMREPAKKLAPTLSPVEEKSRERASSNATSAKSGSKSSGSSSVKSAVTSKGDEETVSLSKPVGESAPEKEKGLPPASAAVENGAAAPKQGKQLRRLGLSGRARRVAGAEDAPSSAESTEELSPADEQPKDPLPVVIRQPRELPSDEELLQKMDEGRGAFSSQAEKGAADSIRGSKQGQEVLGTEQSGGKGITGGREGGSKEPDVAMVEGREAREASRGGKGTLDERRGSEWMDTKGQAVHTKAALPAATSAVSAYTQAELALPVTERGHESRSPRPAQQPGVPRTDLPSLGTNGPTPSLQTSGSAAPQTSRPTKPVISSTQAASPSENARQAEPSQPALNNPAQPQPVQPQNPLQQVTPASSRPRSEPRAPEKDQQRGHGAPQQGPGQATPKQGSSRVASSPAPQAPASANSRGSAHQGAREDDVVWLNGKRYQKLKTVGKGGSSRVYKVIGPDRSEFALKKIPLTGPGVGPEARQGFIEEIELLKRLQKRRNIIRYIDSEVREDVVYVLLEYGEIDLASLLKKEQQKAIEMGSKCVDENFIRRSWQQMLEAVHSVHQERIVHKDLKPANFLSVLGELKLIDFGIAKSMVDDATCIEQQRNHMGTVNYMSPEAIKSATTDVRVSRPSDVWSLGCILYQMAYGQLPFAHVPNQLHRMYVVADPNTKISFPPLRNPHLRDAIQRCLTYSPEGRISIPELLRHPFLRPDVLPAVPPTPPGPAATGFALSEQQIQSILAAVATAAPGSKLDLQEMLRQLAAHSGPGLAAALQQATTSKPPPPPPAPPRAPPPPPPPPPAASKPRGPVRAPLQLVKRAPSVDSRKQGEGLQGDLAAQVARIAAERSRRLQNAASDGSSTPKAGAPNGGLALGVKRALDGSKPESKVSRFIGGSVGTGEENKENAEGYQRLLQQKLASRRKLVEEDVTGGSTATVNFD